MCLRGSADTRVNYEKCVPSLHQIMENIIEPLSYKGLSLFMTILHQIMENKWQQRVCK